MRAITPSGILFVALLLFPGLAEAAEAPVAVSPGDASRLALVEGRCPTFSWGVVSGAKNYDLVVYLLGEEGEEARPVLSETFDGSASSWTPSLDRCLERGDQYAWSVRAVGEKAASDWSAPSLFQVAFGPSEQELEKAPQLVKRYVADQAKAPAVGADPLAGAMGATESDASKNPVRGGGVESLTPSLSATPSLTVDDQIHLAASSDIFKGGSVFLWSDTNGNTGLGDGALASNTTGFSNTGLGDGALASNTSGFRNTASGLWALNSNTTGHYNTAIGNYALTANTTGNYNTASGYGALYYNTTGWDNTASGYYALHSNTTGDGNTASGEFALRNNTTGHRNTASGYRAGYNATTGNDNIFIANDGAAGDSAKIKIGTQSTQTATYVAGIHGSSLTGSSVVVTSTGQLGVASGATGDADTLDGLDSEDFLRSNAASSLTAALIVPTGGSLATTGSGTIAASTASALLGNGSNCAGGTFPAGVDAAGNVESCTADDDQPDNDAEVPDAITIDGGSISNSDMTLAGSVDPSPTAEGQMEWDSDDDRLIVGDGSGTRNFFPGAGRYLLNVTLQDISTAGSAWVAVPEAGTVIGVHSVIDGAIATSDATLTPKIGGTPMTNGTMTVANAGSAAGDVDSSTPTAANNVSSGDAIEIAADGASTGTVAATITLLIERG